MKPRVFASSALKVRGPTWALGLWSVLCGVICEPAFSWEITADAAQNSPEVTFAEVAAAKHVSAKGAEKAGVSGPGRGGQVAEKEIAVDAGASVSLLHLVDGPAVLAGEAAISSSKSVTPPAAGFKRPESVTVRIPESPGREPEASVTVAADLAVPHVTDESVRQAVTPELLVSLVDGQVTFNPRRLEFKRPGEKTRIRLAVSGTPTLALFVRDGDVAGISSDNHEVVARRNGATELYAILAGKMYIVPVVVSGADAFSFMVPKELIRLEGVMTSGLPLEAAHGRIAGSVNGATRAEDDAAVQNGAELANRTLDSEVRGGAVAAVTARWEPEYKDLLLQVMDDRSLPSQGRIYPVAAARVSVSGSAYAGVTDSTGHVRIPDVPADGRFLVRVYDPKGVVQPTVAEIAGGGAAHAEVKRVRTLRAFTFDAYLSALGTAQDAGLGSVCVRVFRSDGAEQNAVGVTVQMDLETDGPVYFNRYGFPDTTQGATGPDGRACFFNVYPGPMALTLSESTSWLLTVPGVAYPGQHSELDVDLDRQTSLAAQLVMTPSAHEWLSGDPAVHERYTAADFEEVIPLGTDQAMTMLDSGLLGFDGYRSGSVQSRAWVLARGADIESTVYSLDMGGRPPVMSLLPRGFVEDMGVYAQVAADPALGSVVAEFAADVATAGAGVDLELLDAFGRDAGEGWYFTDQPVTRAVFFNLPAGKYTLIAKTRDGYWLAADTVLVYNETVSMLRIGGKLVGRRRASAEAMP